MQPPSQRRKPPPAAPRRRAFTLIELLVVMVIISILAALLLPVLRQARNSAYTVTCMHNLKQIAVWGLDYADENDGVLPHNGGWMPEFYGLLSSGKWYEKYPCKRSSTGGTVLHCPQEVASTRPRQTIWGRGCTSFSLNTYLGGSWYNKGVPRTRHLKAQKFWWADGRMVWSSYAGEGGTGYSTFPYMSPPQTWPWTHPEFPGHGRHKANFVFGDGHARSVTQIEYDSLSPDEKQRWVGNGDI